MKDYSTDPVLEPFWFEDSYLDSFEIDEHSAYIRAEIALLPAHPRYEKPPPTKALCWRLGSIHFAGADRIDFVDEHQEPYTNPDGSIHYGDIFGLKITDDGWFLDAEIGTLTVHGGTLTVTLDEDG